MKTNLIMLCMYVSKQVGRSVQARSFSKKYSAVCLVNKKVFCITIGLNKHLLFQCVDSFICTKNTFATINHSGEQGILFYFTILCGLKQNVGSKQLFSSASGQHDAHLHEQYILHICYCYVVLPNFISSLNLQNLSFIVVQQYILRKLGIFNPLQNLRFPLTF